jgi:hypothetical protein
MDLHRGDRRVQPGVTETRTDAEPSPAETDAPVADPPSERAPATAPAQGEASAPPADDPRATGPLAPAWAALERGDHVEAARIARALAEGPDEVIRRDAEDFLARLRPDPVIVMVLVGTGLLLALLAWQYLGLRR